MSCIERTNINFFLQSWILVITILVSLRPFCLLFSQWLLQHPKVGLWPHWLETWYKLHEASSQLILMGSLRIWTRTDSLTLLLQLPLLPTRLPPLPHMPMLLPLLLTQLPPISWMLPQHTLVIKKESKVYELPCYGSLLQKPFLLIVHFWRVYLVYNRYNFYKNVDK